jgi:signal transduction histidine kinase
MKGSSAPRFYVARWALASAALGAALVMLAWRIAVSQSGPLTFAELHERHSIMWIVDMLPTVLGIAGLFIGTLHVRLVEARNRTEEQARQIASAWTADLHAANLQLADSLQERQRFYAAVSHEMRTPLTAIVGYSELTEELRIAPTEVGGYLSEIYSSAGSLLEVVNDLLDAARLETGGITIDLDDVDGNDIAGSVVRRMLPLAAHKSIAIVAELCPAARCRADGGRLHQILTNLVANAIKYSDSGRVVVRTEAAADGVRFDVIDDGPGIAHEDLERIFAAFEQGAGAGSRTDSTGLGLAVSRTFATAMSGKLTATSDGLGHGATFSLWLPAATGDAATATTVTVLSA